MTNDQRRMTELIDRACAANPELADNLRAIAAGDWTGPDADDFWDRTVQIFAEHFACDVAVAIN
jgi:hypothetical protein